MPLFINFLNFHRKSRNLGTLCVIKNNVQKVGIAKL